MKQVDVVPPDPKWRSQFLTEAAAIAQLLSNAQPAIHHIGSTSIPNMYAKPVIDILVEVDNLTRVDQQTPAFEHLGYIAMGEFGIPGRRYFRKENVAGQRTHHIHIFESGSNHVTRHLAFRDYLTAHPAEAQQYSNLKRELARQFPHDIERYMDGKDGLIKVLEARALQWQTERATAELKQA